MNYPEVRQSEDELRAWDWYAELKAQERGIPWLARQTGRQQNTVYLIKWRKMRPSVEWLQAVWDLRKGDQNGR